MLLEDWTNTIVRVEPTRIVAKVGTSHFRDARLESLERELAVAIHLAARGAPVIRPTQEVPAGPHHYRGLMLTLWQYVEPIPGASVAPEQMATALTLVHDALAHFKPPLPRFIVELDDARRLLQRQRSPRLEPPDRRYLLDTVSELQTALGSLGGAWQPLHGSPHAANWLPSEDGPLLLDFETACQGPVEWDLAALADDALGRFPAADHELISIMRRMRSVCVAAKCWVSPDRSPEVREAAEVHLNLLRGQQPD